MADKTGIEWTDATWNPTKGCDRVSPGCDHCYAMTQAVRMKAMGSPGYQLDGDPKTSGPGFLAHEWPDALDQPLRWTRPRRIFVNSMSDLFHDNISDEFIAQVFAVMAWSQQHTFQVLTKRHARMRSLLSSPAFVEKVDDAHIAVMTELMHDTDPRITDPDYLRTAPPFNWPIRNLWLGVSVENQQWADIRIPALLETPAAVRFLSCEPLLGPVDLTRIKSSTGSVNHVSRNHLNALAATSSRPTVDWVIAGGESGPGSRPMHPGWSRQLRDQCDAANVPFLFKQWGDWAGARGWRGMDHHLTIDGRLFEPGERLGMDHMMRPVAIHKWGKKLAGRELDGRMWDEYPSA